MKNAGVSALAAALVAYGSLAGCGSDASSQFHDAPDATVPDGGLTDAPQATDSTDSPSIIGNDIVSIAIAPPNPIVVVQNGVVPAALAFKGIGTTTSGSKVTVYGGQWAYDRYDVGSIDALSGSFAATGFIGGVGNVSLKFMGLTATTTATVVLRMTSGTDPGVFGQGDGGALMPDPAMQLVYPYDATVFPRGLASPVLQWNGGGAGDLYRITVNSPTVTFDAFTTVPPPSRYSFPVLTPDAGAPIDVWRKITDSTTGALTLAVQRYDGTKAYLPVIYTWTIASADLAGTVFYWRINTTQSASGIARLKIGAAAPTDFASSPPPAGCIACHSVSKNGKTLVASFNGGASPWGTFDTATGNSLFVSDTSQAATYASGFEAISPDGQYVLWRHWSDNAFGSLGYLVLSTFNNPADLGHLDPGDGPTKAPSHPTWSNDGKKLAYALRDVSASGNGLDFSSSTLWIADVAGSPPVFSNQKQIVANTSTRGVVTYPAFSPDGKWIAFERCTQSRSRGGNSEVWLGSTDGSVLLSLDKANTFGIADTNPSDHQLDATYEPTFMPVAVGGYFWLVVVSERQYGNTLTDINTASRTKQLWVTAIDAAPTAGQDPSHPAFWLAGQELDHQNMRGEWALDPCKPIGQTCQAGYECCTGFCRAGADGGAPICTMQPPGCSANGESCMMASDCCAAGAQCIGGFCNDTPK